MTGRTWHVSAMQSIQIPTREEQKARLQGQMRVASLVVNGMAEHLSRTIGPSDTFEDWRRTEGLGEANKVAYYDWQAWTGKLPGCIKPGPYPRPTETKTA